MQVIDGKLFFLCVLLALSGTITAVADPITTVLISTYGGTRLEEDASDIYNVSHIEKVTGKVFNLPKNTQVVLAMRSKHDTRWRIIPCTLHPTREGTFWQAILTLPNLEDAPVGMEIMAAVVRVPVKLYLSDSEIHRACLDVSPQLLIHRPAAQQLNASWQGQRPPVIRITRVGTQAARRSQILPVSMKEYVTAHVENVPRGMYLQAIVQAAETETYWPMPGSSMPEGGTWQGTALFGRKDMDQCKQFWLYVVMTREPLPTPPAGINCREWRRYRFAAVSAPISVIRTVEDTDIIVEITQIGGNSAPHRQYWPVMYGSRVEGTVAYISYVKRRIDPHQILLLAAPEAGAVWTIAGKGIITQSWSDWTVVSAQYLPKKTKQRLMAVALPPEPRSSRGKAKPKWAVGAQFTGWESVVSLSNEVYIAVMTEEKKPQ